MVLKQVYFIWDIPQYLYSFILYMFSYICMHTNTVSKLIEASFQDLKISFTTFRIFLWSNKLGCSWMNLLAKPC